MKVFLVAFGAFALVVAIGMAMGLFRRVYWEDYPLLPGEKTLQEDAGGLTVELGSSGPKSRSYVHPRVRLTDRRLIVGAPMLFSSRVVVMTVVYFADGAGASGPEGLPAADREPAYRLERSVYRTDRAQMTVETKGGGQRLVVPITRVSPAGVTGWLRLGGPRLSEYLRALGL